MLRSLCILCVALITTRWCEAGVDFEGAVAPIISAKCVECHNTKDKSGGLDLTSQASLMQGGDSGVVLVSEKPEESPLYQRVEKGEMPPESAGKSHKLPDAEIAVLKVWITEGATWPKDRVLDLYERTNESRAGRDWWTFQAVKRPAVPAVAPAERVRTPVDTFILDQLKHEQLTMGPEADKRALVRRAYEDLWGLPPTYEQIEEYVNDQSADAFEKLLDRLLASPHYGERWGRYWLDVVRYAETCGYERDQLKPGIWKYRDWVINALNSDMPYDRFVLHQLAGDEIPDRDEQSVIATGMLRAGTWNDEPNDPADYLYERLEDMVDTTSSAFLGLTVKCARCHDHKFDPIQQTDYYRIASFFWAGYMGQANLGGPTKDELGINVFGWTDKGPTAEPIRLLIKGERSQPGEVIEPGFLSAVSELDQALSPPPAGSRTTQRRLQFAKWVTDVRNPLAARVMVNRLWLHHFGEGLVRSPNNFGFKSDPPTHPELLDWLAAEFMHPTWEAESGRATDSAVPWSMKRIHRLLMLSSVYRQSSNHPLEKEYAQRDFTNRNWWRFNRQRLDAEALRDAILVASGTINDRVGGESFLPSMSSEALEGLSRKDAAWTASPPEEQRRRSVYMRTVRSRVLPMMTAFDFCDTTRTCGQRDVTTVPPQALALLNNEFIHQKSDELAERVVSQVGNDVEAQAATAWKLILGRNPDADERAGAVTHLQEQTAHFTATVQQSRHPTDAASPIASEDAVRALMDNVMWLRADQGVETDATGQVLFWRDQVQGGGRHPHDASQADSERRPLLVKDGLGGQPAIRFDGQKSFLQVDGQVIHSPEFSLFAVATHRGTDDSPREILTNWNRAGRSTSSIFLGTVGVNGVRFSDAFGGAGQLNAPSQPFILTGVTSATEAETFQNRQSLATHGGLADRDLLGPYVIGTQGDLGGEFWKGEIAEIIAFDRALPDGERQIIWSYLTQKYAISDQAAPTVVRTPEQLALASLCLVLLNTNEFVYVD